MIVHAGYPAAACIDWHDIADLRVFESVLSCLGIHALLALSQPLSGAVLIKAALFAVLAKPFIIHFGCDVLSACMTHPVCKIGC